MKNLTVSKPTVAIIECMQALNAHRERMLEALSKTYYEETAYKIVREKYDPVFMQLKEVVNGFFIDIVEDHIELTEDKELKEI